MDELLLQRTRYVLRSRARRVQTCPDVLFLSACQQFMDWLNHHPVLAAITANLRCLPGEFRARIDQTMAEAPTAQGNYDPGFYRASSVTEHAALCLKLVEAVAATGSLVVEGKRDFLLANLGEYITQNNRIQVEEAIRVIRDVAVDGLYEYLDEQLDARNVLYAILLKYKQRSEWFHRARLRQTAEQGLEGRRGERALAVDLQGYVLDQGVEFVVEPTSASGEVDLILRDSDGGYVVIDAKYITVDATRSDMRDRLAHGFHQVARYCDDFNEPSGYLVAFVCTPTRIRLELEESDGFRYLVLGGKTIYFLPVDIADLPSASKAGKAEEVTISKAELVTALPVQSQTTGDLQ